MKGFNTTLTPPGGYRFVHPETGHLTKATNYRQLLHREREYRQANKLPIGSEFEQQIVDYLCAEMLKAGWTEGCIDTEPPTFAEMAVSFGHAMLQWAKDGFRVVTHDQYQARLQTCRACDRWRGEARMGLGKCARCGCAGLKLFAGSERCPAGKWEAIA